MTRVRVAVLLVGSALQRSALPAPSDSPSSATKQLGPEIIGTDSARVPQFVQTFHARPEWKIRIVAAFKGGSPDPQPSATRIEGFTTTYQKSA